MAGKFNFYPAAQRSRTRTDEKFALCAFESKDDFSALNIPNRIIREKIQFTL